LILEAQGQARSHLKFNPSWSYEGVQFSDRLVRQRQRALKEY
jgi:hypothetical protein